MDNSATADLGGWLYLDLNGFEADSELGVAERANDDAQAWVAIQMFAEGRYSVLYDAAMLENGCTPALDTTSADSEDDDSSGSQLHPGSPLVPAVEAPSSGPASAGPLFFFSRFFGAVVP